MARERKGTVLERKDGSIWARVIFTDASGKKRDLQRRAKNRTDAKLIIKELLAEIEERGQRGLDGQRMTFRELAAEYEKHKLFPAEYHGTRKIAGLRSWKAAQGFLQVLVEKFGNLPIRDITHADIEKFKRNRLKEPVARKVMTKAKEWETIVTEKPRAIASVNRELETMRAVMNFAKRQKWIISSPFEEGDPVISKADETKRERVLTFEEERRLLAACTNEEYEVTYTRKGKPVKAMIKGRREHLRPLIITALDTGMRRGEMFKLRWREVDLVSKTITITELNSKTAKARHIAMTPRVFDEFNRLREASPKDLNGLVFGIEDTIKRGWTTACFEAGIEGLRFHDLRHTALTRMIQAGLPPMEVMKISGHTQMGTFARYINPASEALQRAASILAGFHAEQAEQAEQTYMASRLVN